MGTIKLPHIDDGYNLKININRIILNGLLIMLFGIHHSLFARTFIKNFIHKNITSKLERSIYNFTACTLAILVIYNYNNIGGGVVWDFTSNNHHKTTTTTTTLSEFHILLINNIGIIIGTIISSYTTYLVGVIELVGLAQAFKNTDDNDNDKNKNKNKNSDNLNVSGIYGIIRHPMQFGVLCLFWVTPFMTLQRLLFCCFFTIYILIRINFEEQSLIERFEQYTQYQKNVPQIIPFLYFFKRKVKKTKKKKKKIQLPVNNTSHGRLIK